jgi:hypothetical protein
MGGAGGSYWAICWLFHVQVLFIRHSGPRLYPLTKSVGHQTSYMSCSTTYDAHKNIRWSKRGGSSWGFASRAALSFSFAVLVLDFGTSGTQRNRCPWPQPQPQPQPPGPRPSASACSAHGRGGRGAAVLIPIPIPIPMPKWEFWLGFRLPTSDLCPSASSSSRAPPQNPESDLSDCAADQRSGSARQRCHALRSTLSISG